MASHLKVNFPPKSSATKCSSLRNTLGKRADEISPRVAFQRKRTGNTDARMNAVLWCSNLLIPGAQKVSAVEKEHCEKRVQPKRASCLFCCSSWKLEIWSPYRYTFTFVFIARSVKDIFYFLKSSNGNALFPRLLYQVVFASHFRRSNHRTECKIRMDLSSNTACRPFGALRWQKVRKARMSARKTKRKRSITWRAKSFTYFGLPASSWSAVSGSVQWNLSSILLVWWGPEYCGPCLNIRCIGSSYYLDVPECGARNIQSIFVLINWIHI